MQIELHPETPQARRMNQIANQFQNGALMVYPTDSGYSLGCNALNKKAVHRLYHLKRAMKKYLMALMVPEFSAITRFATVDNRAFRYMKHLLPGPYTFILPSTQEAKKILTVKRSEVGVRMPKHPFISSLHQIVPYPILNTAAQLNEMDAFLDPLDLQKHFGKLVDMVIDMGPVAINPTTVIRLTSDEPEVVREGAGPVP